MADAKNVRIVFMGTPEFAMASAEALRQAKMSIVAVVTVPDKPAGRGRHMQQPAMKQWAVARAIPVLQPDDLRAPSFLQQLHDLQADLFVVVAFRILPPEVFTIPRLGTINLHASLLPKYRGAAPINWALIEGESETGVTTFVIDEKVDTGGILLQRRMSIGPDETFGDLCERLEQLGADLLVETIVRFAAGEIRPQKQEGEPTRAPKITPELRVIDWSQPAERIYNLIRGLSPVPCAISTLRGKMLKIFACRPLQTTHSGAAGEIIVADAKQGTLVVQTGDGALRLLDVQLEGKKRMAVANFLRGHAVHVGDVLD